MSLLIRIQFIRDNIPSKLIFLRNIIKHILNMNIKNCIFCFIFIQRADLEVGDRVWARYSVDGKEYEAEILKID